MYSQNKEGSESSRILDDRDSQLISETDRNASTQKRGVRWIKLVCGFTSAACFGLGLRAAWIQAKPLRPGELSRRSILSGSGIALQALGIATVISVSGYILLLIAISEALGVDSWKQFGQRMTNMFGDRFRISKGGSGKSYDTFLQVLEASAKGSDEGAAPRK